MSIINDKLSTWTLKKRLPFYVQLAHACPEDIDDPNPLTFLAAIFEAGRWIIDFLQWRHPIGRGERRNFLKTIYGEKEARTEKEAVFLNWRQQCWAYKNHSDTHAVPPYNNLFSTVLNIQGGTEQAQNLNDETEKFILENALSDDKLSWFENATCEGDEAAEDAAQEENFQEYLDYLKPLPPTDALEYAIDAPEEYEAIVYGDNSDILPDSYDETGDEERYSAYEDYIENKLSSNVGQQKK